MTLNDMSHWIINSSFCEFSRVNRNNLFSFTKRNYTRKIDLSCISIYRNDLIVRRPSDYDYLKNLIRMSWKRPKYKFIRKPYQLRYSPLNFKF